MFIQHSQFYYFINALLFFMLQAIWDRHTILFLLLSITCRVEGRLSYLLEIFLMLIDMSTMMSVYGGTHGVNLLKEAQHISHGFGLLEITK